MFSKELKSIGRKNEDIKCAHADADQVLCVLLLALGYEKVVTEYNKARKRYT